MAKAWLLALMARSPLDTAARIPVADLAPWDEVAAMTTAPDSHLAELLLRYEHDRNFLMPGSVCTGRRFA